MTSLSKVFYLLHFLLSSSSVEVISLASSKIVGQTSIIIFSNVLNCVSKHIFKFFCFVFVFAASIFSGKYGSELEFKLESGLDMLLDQKQRISIAKYKWQNSRLLINHAVQQMKYAIKKWSELMQLQNRLVSSTISCMFCIKDMKFSYSYIVYFLIIFWIPYHYIMIINNLVYCLDAIIC